MGTPECLAACCGVTGFYRATPCRPGVGCGGGPSGVPLWIPRDYVCADGPRTSVIGVDRACYQVDTSVVWELCPVGGVPKTRYCIPLGGRVLAPGTPVNCYPDCNHPDCRNSLPRWITIRPCRPGAWPPSTPLPIIRADGFEAGCIVGRASGGDCWTADCGSVFAASEAEVADRIFGGSIDFAYRSCCQCQCQGGGVATLGCEELYPPPAPQPITCCCPPIVDNPGATWTYEATFLRTLDEPGQHYLERVQHRGSFGYDANGNLVGTGTRVTHIESQVGGGEPFIFDETIVLSFPPIQLVCPPPLWNSRPCPDPNKVWTGRRNCQVAVSRLELLNTGYDQEFTTGRVTLSGVDYRPCTGGCGEVFELPFGLIESPPRGVIFASPTGMRRPAKSSGGCAGCGGRGL